ncbi:hypothetical protein FHW16_001661 [Phyllobacterium myrsinacearum]|uniref:Uncharacterized protein n=1 Tax=Phyllobacterium myrsinacearum TaxID=28101 RepID=A0A839EGU7_9HYPH|nr:hypothetical protein [Phyllobacterium myrsinacearum]
MNARKPLPHDNPACPNVISFLPAMVNAPLTIRAVTWESNLRLFTTAVRAFT